MSAIPLFKYVDLETCSSCNRVCPTCLRNSHPNREALQSWFEPEFLPVRIIKDALNQCMELGFLGSICLSHYNEHIATHFSPKFDVKCMAEKYREHPCSN